MLLDSHHLRMPLINTINKKGKTLDPPTILISFSNMRNKDLLNMNASTK